MSTSTRPRRLLAAAGTAALAVTLGLSLGSASAPAQADHQHGAAPGPIHAGNTYGWGKAPVDYRFVGPLKRSQWKVKGPGAVRNQHGMLTLNTAKRGTVSATQITQGHSVGRWEIRLRSRQYGHGGTNYRVLTELVPAGKRPEYCGAKNIALEAYTPNKTIVSHYIRSRPDDRYFARTGLGLHNDQWHTFAVEVTKTRISWFVDAHVVSTERRDDALTGVPFAVRFTMEGVDGKRMNQSRMQMDWLRYWTLRKPNTRSTKAPETTHGTFKGGCGASR
ncbi:MAG: hypothetical protein JWN91_4150 [Nocardioides sp.]|nr:hypothetical protein [Nocardioides sp.]